MRVHELANELRKSLREVTDRLRKLEIPYKTNLSSITQQDANRVRKSFDRPLVKIEKPKKKAAKKPAKKPAAKKAEKKPAAKKAAAKPAAKKAEKKPAAKKASVKPAARKAAAKPAAKKPAVEVARKVPAEAPAPAAKPAAPQVAPPAKAAAPAPAKPAVTGKPAPPAGRPAPARPGAPRPGKPAAQPPGARKPGAPPAAGRPSARPAGAAPRRDAIPPAAARPEKKRTKRTLRVAPPDRRSDVRIRQPEKKVYRFVPKGRGAAARTGAPPTTVAPKLLRVPSGVTVKDFAQKAGLTPAELIRKLMSFGEMLTVNQAISDEALKLLAEDLGTEIKIKPTTHVDEFEEISDKEEDLKPRPPVVTVMGHVDHGKTLLLDTIRKTDVVSTEMGGITQHIGAYQVAFRGKPITFIDTPGHESFTAMRARGAQATDVVVLVVAADDGVMPQTVEALDHALEAQVPIIVAVNKIDKQDADAYRVRQQLSERGLIPEDWGGETVFAEVSAKQGTNIEHLLEMVLLVSDLQELKANPDTEAGGVVVEAKLDKARGPVATVLVQRGTARVGDVVVVGTAWGKIRAMFDDKGEAVDVAGPSFPVEILGLSTLPMAGDEFRVVEDEKKARQMTDRRRMHKKLEEQATPQRHVSLENLFDRIKEGELNQLKVVLKADAQGSLEAIAESLEKLSLEEVKLNVIHSGVGGITETDVMLASASDAIILGFNVRPDSKAARIAERERVDVRTYQVIYQLTEDMEAALKGMLAPLFEEEVIGRAEVRQTFRVPGMGTIAGSYVLDGEIARNAQARVLREGVVVYDGRIGSLRRFKDDVKTVAAGFECGIGLEDFNDLKDGDILEAYRMREVPR
ncbi:MAG: translation initiation factor IF-2 [Actinobacteria bacterium]|nr:translation initiation factor IF-2 [Actinomycetota bacterium]MBU1944683.1 translation initiation factor IF-2 [Actinomycetota bacterium]MBU2689231.1 translation initiation factor IF-2 [Actinomycetota bacterium]